MCKISSYLAMSFVDVVLRRKCNDLNCFSSYFKKLNMLLIHDDHLGDNWETNSPLSLFVVGFYVL